MSQTMSANEAQYHAALEEWRARHHPPARYQSSGLSLTLTVAGLAVIGLGALAWYYLGPDLQRYLKIRSM